MRSCVSGWKPQILSPLDWVAGAAQPSSSAKDDFGRYLASITPHKAFAVSLRGAYGWRSNRATVIDAQRDALAACGKWADDCSLYAVDDRLATGLNTARGHAEASVQPDHRADAL